MGLVDAFRVAHARHASSLTPHDFREQSLRGFRSNGRMIVVALA